MDLSTIGMLAFGVALVLALFGLTHLGTAVGNRRLAVDPVCFRKTAATDGVVYALLGLLMAFSFSDATSRFERRRNLIVDEANALSTAASRFDLIAEPRRGELRSLLGRYIEARLALTDPAPTLEEVGQRQPLVVERQAAVWAVAIAACRETAPTTALTLLPPLNEAFDLGEVRRNVLYHDPPLIILVMLLALALAAAFIAGQSMAGSASPLLFHRIAFAAVITLTAATTIDLELARRGLIRISDSDRLLIDLVAALR